MKVYEVMDDVTGSVVPKYNLEPPHYDGIQSLCLKGDFLFSGSRDTCIKKWDLAGQQLKQASEDKIFNFTSFVQVLFKKSHNDIKSLTSF